MTTATLFLIQSPFSNTEHALGKLNELYCAKDAVVLMGDAVLALASQHLSAISQIYVLENEAELISNTELNHYNLISYDEFSDIVLSFKRCISLK